MSDELKSEAQFVLTTKTSYSNKGEQVNAEFIELTAPTSKHSKECAALKQSFFRALPQNEEAKDPEAKDVEITGDEVMVLISMSQVVDLGEVINVGKRLLAGGVAMIDGEVKLTNNVIDNMSQDDVEQMIGFYMINFILASSLARIKSSL